MTVVRDPREYGDDVQALHGAWQSAALAAAAAKAALHDALEAPPWTGAAPAVRCRPTRAPCGPRGSTPSGCS